MAAHRYYQPRASLVIGALVLLLTPHAAVVRAQILDVVGGGNAETAKAMAQSFAAAGLQDQLTKTFSDLDAAKVADFIAAFGSGDNLQQLKDALDTLKTLTAKDQYTAARDTLRDGGALLVEAISAGPFALIALLALSLGLAGAITSTVGGALYAAGSAVGLYVAIAVAENNQIAACTPSAPPGASEGPTIPGVGGDTTTGSTGGGSSDNGGYNCDKYNQGQAQDWMKGIVDLSKEANKDLVSLVNNGIPDQLLGVVETTLKSVIQASKTAGQA